ncbi:hypothetical protein ALC53_13419 [Atta colombica]|uniref:Uncharacterized protein n=1 Tax=Atta colombica TaxID=520822 RepID=A0A195AV96_9HYME|nr:hypothetical protein ALC53_13419 [Atta colombica]
MLIIFINATLVSQLEWGSFWFMSTANTHLSIINSILCSAYKMTMGLPKSVASKVYWKFSCQKSFISRISRLMKSFLFKFEMLKESRGEKCSFCNGKIGKNQGIGGKLYENWHTGQEL